MLEHKQEDHQFCFTIKLVVTQIIHKAFPLVNFILVSHFIHFRVLIKSNYILN